MRASSSFSRVAVLGDLYLEIDPFGVDCTGVALKVASNKCSLYAVRVLLSVGNRSLLQCPYAGSAL